MQEWQKDQKEFEIFIIIRRIKCLNFTGALFSLTLVLILFTLPHPDNYIGILGQYDTLLFKK